MTRSSLRCRWSDEESVSQTWRWEALTHSLAVGAAARSCRRHVFDSGSVWFTAGVRSDESLDFSDRTCTLVSHWSNQQQQQETVDQTLRRSGSSFCSVEPEHVEPDN
ncbi:hypothetical protein F2P81_006749 [Scophthalmus maximus]|uniref:Uncharacterized protein n=1 Tax=Scophthalmus maximus TaxID=52904 RepID=A0A6A4TD95_SCOMX|nr:hypothetical protein F2P81_006749 [Scophthalmus maximus]